MADTIKDREKFKVIKLEQGLYDYDTIFIEVNKKVVQIPVEKVAVKDKQIVGKSISVPYKLMDDKEYLFDSVITKIEFMQ